MLLLLRLLGFVLFAANLHAIAPHPTTLTVRYKGQMLPVIRVIGTDPVVLVNGKEKRIRTESIYLPLRTHAFSPDRVSILKASLGGTQTSFVVNEGDAANTSPKIGAHGGLAEFNATLKAEDTVSGGFIAVVLYTPAVLASDSPLAATQIIVREMPVLPAGVEVPIRITSKMFTLVPGQRFFIQIFDQQGREIFTQASKDGWAYYALIERAQLADAVKRYRERFAGQNRAPSPVITIKPILPATAILPREGITAQLTVTPDGYVDEVSLSDALGSSAERAIRTALGGWLFLPRLEAGEPVHSTVRVPLKF